MPLAERIKRKIVPQRGFCSLAPGNGALLSGNGAVSIELACDPYTEQIPFRHESLFVPRRRPFEAPKIAGSLPAGAANAAGREIPRRREARLRRMAQEPHRPAVDGMGGGGGFSMRLESPRTASVKDYLRTVDFESTEVKVHWTDERGEWIRRTFASRPDNLVVQWLTAPQGTVGECPDHDVGGRGRARRGAERGGAGLARAAGGMPAARGGGPATSSRTSTSSG